ncbi:MAG TPA: DUF1361 domain-containing protein [Myxococcales bacterium]|nr:DUF1361 domain-containing protein [Myxococcales bacterium]
MLPAGHSLPALLRAHGLPAMALCLGASSLLVWIRILASGTSGFAFMPWNVTLAFVPYSLSLFAAALERSHARPWPLLATGALALLFLPNSFYVATDLVHFRARGDMPAWFDIGLLSMAAGTGWFLGLLSLRIWKRLLTGLLGAFGAWAAVLLGGLLCGYGIYLGRFLRWNSWDVLSAPRALFADIAGHLVPPWNPEVVGVTALFGALVVVTFVAFELFGETPEAAR